MWHILGFQIYFCIGNDISRVHGSVDPVVGAQRVGTLGERDIGGDVLTGGEGSRQGIRIEPATERNVDVWHTLLGAAYMRGGGEIGRFWVLWEMAEAVPHL
jgi:hypothetical protein